MHPSCKFAVHPYLPKTVHCYLPTTDGEAAFFSADKRKGYCHKIRGSVLESIQKKLDKGQSVTILNQTDTVFPGTELRLIFKNCAD